MDDDFNSAGALGQLFELVRMINIARDAGATDAELEPAQAMLRELTDVFGLLLNEPKADRNQAAADPFIQLLIDLRTELRKQKNWELSDKVRDRLAELGVVLEDGKDGTRWHWA
jgi:cysteinyl-tRNA synthetase